MEVTTVLALVGSRRLGDGVSVDGALDVGRWGRVLGASDGRVCGRVALEEDVEAKAELLAVAEVGTLLDVVGTILDDLVCQVTNLLSGSQLIGERFDIASRRSSGLSSLPQVTVDIGVLIDGAVTWYMTGTACSISNV